MKARSSGKSSIYTNNSNIMWNRSGLQDLQHYQVLGKEYNSVTLPRGF